MERTFCLIKPDGVLRRLVGRIVSRIEDKGLRIVAMKLVRVTPSQAAELYSAHRREKFYRRLVRFVTSSPAVAMAVEGHRAVAVVRKLLGATRGFEAEPGTVRGDFGGSETLNLAHGADSPDAARREIAIFFGRDEMAGYGRADRDWIYKESER